MWWVGGVVVQSHFIVKPNLVLRLGWGFDNSANSTKSTKSAKLTISTNSTNSIQFNLVIKRINIGKIFEKLPNYHIFGHHMEIQRFLKIFFFKLKIAVTWSFIKILWSSFLQTSQ